jgi:CRP/FNR family transcriptional regulator, anaerobic regulatory protein
MHMIKRQLIYSVFPFLESEKFSGIDDFEKFGISTTIPKGKIISVEGDNCISFPFVVSGKIRVHKSAESGRDITLYRLERGDSCILTASCIISKKKFPAISVAETDTQVISIPSEMILEWIEKYDFWRKYIFDLLSSRLASIISVVEEVAFRNVDIRLADHLFKLYEQFGKEIATTHQLLASDLGTSREVVSRLLKDLENENILLISRGKIKILDADSLKKKSSL